MDRDIQANDTARRLMFRSVIVSVIFAVVFSLVIGFLVNKTTVLSNENKKNSHAQCVNSNINRANVIEIWEYFFTRNPNPTPTQLAEINAARAKVLSVYKQQPCP